MRFMHTKHNPNRLSIRFSYLDMLNLDMISKIVMNLYATVEIVLKKLISSFNTSLVLMFKGKPSSTKSPVWTRQKIKAESKNRFAYIVISKTKM